MEYEVDFLPAGDGQKSGDVITLRFGNLNVDPPEQFVVVVDGGFESSGQALVDHIQEFYGTSHVDLAISTHPDTDHASGLGVVLEQLTVDELWMHLPWNHTDDIARLFQGGRVTDQGVRESLRRSLERARTLEQMASRRGIPIREPFTGLQNSTGNLVVVGPSVTFYESLLPEFRGTPIPAAASGLVASGARAVGDIIRRIAENWNFETLTDDGLTSAENNTSTILMLNMDGDVILLTADAGIPALEKALDVLEAAGSPHADLKLVQVPHHGSQRNVGPTVLDRLLGPRRPTDEQATTAYVSVAAQGAPKHPSKKVMNAFRRRGALVVATQGKTICLQEGAPPRPGWGPADPLPFYNEVEE